ncbi:hypothetical protein O9993_08235 [Vibrio lentus]|nr:hypothetical protein [Vibrio lentus]
MMTTAKVVPFAVANADKYADNGYAGGSIQQRRDRLCKSCQNTLQVLLIALWEMGYSELKIFAKLLEVVT